MSYGDLTESPRTNDTEEDLVIDIQPNTTSKAHRSHPLCGDEYPRPVLPRDNINNINTSNQSALSNNHNQESPSRGVSFCVEDEISNQNRSISPIVVECDIAGTAEDVKHSGNYAEPKKRGISGRFKAKLFPGKHLPKKRVNSIKKVEKYVHAISVNTEQVETRCVTPVFDQEDVLETDDFIRKRSEFLSHKPNNLTNGCDEIIILDIPESQDDHIEAAMERRQTLLRHRDEKKNSLKLEGILEESPQSSPNHGVTLPTPEDYEDYLDADVEQDYPELADSPAGLDPDNSGRTQGSYGKNQDEGRYNSGGRGTALVGSSSMVFADDQSPQQCVAVFCGVELPIVQEAKVLPSRELTRDFYCNGFSIASLASSSSSTRMRSLSDSHDYSSSSHNPHSTSTLKSIRSISSYESQTCSPIDTDYSNKLVNRDSIARCSIGSTSGYSSMSFDSSSAVSKKKKATLFLPTITTSLPEISLQPPTPQAPKPKPCYDSDDKVKYDLKAPGYRSMFLTVPGTEDEDNDKFLPGSTGFEDDSDSSGSSSDNDDDDVIHKPRMLSTLASYQGGLRRFGSSCDISSLGLTIPSIGTDEDEAHSYEDDRDTTTNDEKYLECSLNDSVREEFLEYKTSYSDDGHKGTINTDCYTNETILSEPINNRYSADSISLDESQNKLSCEHNSRSYTVTDQTNANVSMCVPSLKSKIGGTGCGSFVASKLAMFEKVAEDEHQRYIECQEARDKVHKAPKMTGEYLDKFYAPQVNRNILAKSADAIFSDDRISDSEHYKTNSEDQIRKKSSTTSLGRKRPPRSNLNNDYRCNMSYLSYENLNLNVTSKYNSHSLAIVPKVGCSKTHLPGIKHPINDNTTNLFNTATNSRKVNCNTNSTSSSSKEAFLSAGITSRQDLGYETSSLSPRTLIDKSDCDCSGSSHCTGTVDNCDNCSQVSHIHCSKL